MACMCARTCVCVLYEVRVYFVYNDVEYGYVCVCVSLWRLCGTVCTRVGGACVCAYVCVHTYFMITKSPLRCNSNAGKL